MKKNLSLFVSFAALVLLAGAGCSNNTAVNPNQPATTNETSAPHETTNPGATIDTAVKPSSGLTAADVAKHNTPESCYIIVSGSVYDVTKFTYQHPGGSDKIIPLCGKDATAPFTQQHGGQRQPENVLAGLKIGNLQK